MDPDRIDNPMAEDLPDDWGMGYVERGLVSDRADAEADEAEGRDRERVAMEEDEERPRDWGHETDHAADEAHDRRAD